MPLTVIQEFVEALNAIGRPGGRDPYGYLSGDIQVDIAGKTPISGTYRGLDQVRGILVSTLKRRLSGFSIKLVDAIAENESLAVKLVLSGVTLTQAKINPEGNICGAFVMTEKGKITSITLIPDTDEILSALFGLMPAASQ